MRRLNQFLLWFFVVTIAAVVFIASVYFHEMRVAYARIQDKSNVISSPYGNIEYLEGGPGPDVLVIHGSGGGFDQGELLAKAALSNTFHWVAPSRFGYLRSTFHPSATFDEQARAYAYLLDQLHIDRVAVVALSHGGPSALLFAVLYPERVSSLTLISAGIASTASADQVEANRKGDSLMQIYQSNFRYWALTHAFNKQFLSIMGADNTVIAALSAEQRTLVDEIVDGMNPVEPRAAGTAFDNKAKMPNERIAAIKAPVLIIHAKDDTLQLFHQAEFAASTIPGARLVSFDRGGHLLLAVQQPAIRALIKQHIMANLEGVSRLSN
jgi:2-hydroxy-6-oxonona-2,4-dienedioate hydrolase